MALVVASFCEIGQAFSWPNYNSSTITNYDIWNLEIYLVHLNSFVEVKLFSYKNVTGTSPLL